jgi:hypothetical protein
MAARVGYSGKYAHEKGLFGVPTKGREIIPSAASPEPARATPALGGLFNKLFLWGKLERAMRFELTTSTLANLKVKI